MKFSDLLKPLTIATLSATAIVVPAASADAAQVCAKWAATSGSDAAAGTQAAPFRSLNKLASSLAPGQVGCLPAGQTYFAVDGNGIVNTAGGTPGNPIVITSGPGQPAVVKGQLWFKPATHDVTLEGLAFAGTYNQAGDRLAPKGVMLNLQGDRTTLQDNDITSAPGICIQLGDSNIADPAERPVVRRNTIHGCGMDPTLVWYPTDSGAHGLYIQNTTDVEVSENVFVGNRTRGLQFYPRNDGGQVHHNLFVRNATHVNLGSEGADKTTNADVYANIFADRVTDWAPNKNSSQVFGNLPMGSFGNLVSANCYDAGDLFVDGYGITTAGDNVTGSPRFVDPAAGDYRLVAGSDCIGFGPASIQPAGEEPEPEPSEPRPDLQVRVGDGAWLGDDVYNVSGADQSVALELAPNTTGRVQLRLENDATGADQWVVAGSPSNGHAGLTHRWGLASGDVTDLVDDGSLVVHDVAADGTRAMSFDVTATEAASGRTVDYFLHLYHAPIGASPIKDVVRIQVTVPAAQEPAPVLQPLVAPRLKGQDVVGRTVSVTRGMWPAGTTITQQWTIDGKPISGATGSRLVVRKAHTGKVLRVTVLAAHDDYQNKQITLRFGGRVTRG